MALAWDGTSSDKAATSSLNGITVDTSCAFSACGWCAGNTAQKSPFGISNGTNLQFELLRRAATNDINAFGYGTAALFTNLALPTSSTEWWFWAFSISGTAIGSATLYLWTQGGGWVSSTNVTALQVVASPTTMTAGAGPVVGTEAWIGNTLGYKVWNAVLTAEEIYRERLTLMPKRLAGLTHFLPMIGGSTDVALRDFLQNTWTLTGTITVADEMPSGVGYGAPHIIVPQSPASVPGIPVLSLPGVQNIASTTAQPKVTLTYS